MAGLHMDNVYQRVFQAISVTSPLCPSKRHGAAGSAPQPLDFVIGGVIEKFTLATQLIREDESRADRGPGIGRCIMCALPVRGLPDWARQGRKNILHPLHPQGTAVTVIDFTAFIGRLATTSGETILPFFRTSLSIDNKSTQISIRSPRPTAPPRR